MSFIAPLYGKNIIHPLVFFPSMLSAAAIVSLVNDFAM
jgi:hypothetical protein